MSRTARLIVGGIVAALILVLVALVYIWVSGGAATPSATLSAPTLDLSTAVPTTAPTSAPATDEATEIVADATDEPTSEATAESLSADPTSEATAETAAELVVFNLVTDDSQVRFILNELLQGRLNTVTGRTDQIAGQIAVDFANPQNSRVGEIRISARSLATDSELRNRAIRSQILQSAQDQFEFISFVPTTLTDLPASVTIGESFEFELTGDLTIRDVTNPVTFAVTVTPVSETRIEGTATATVQRGDYGLEIPSVPGVADVDEAVRLEIDFAAEAG